MYRYCWNNFPLLGLLEGFRTNSSNHASRLLKTTRVHCKLCPVQVAYDSFLKHSFCLHSDPQLIVLHQTDFQWHLEFVCTDRGRQNWASGFSLALKLAWLYVCTSCFVHDDIARLFNCTTLMNLHFSSYFFTW